MFIGTCMILFQVQSRLNSHKNRRIAITMTIIMLFGFFFFSPQTEGLSVVLHRLRADVMEGSRNQLLIVTS